MPTEMTFASLQSDLQGYLERGTNVDATVFNQLPKLINNAERRLARDMKVLGFKQVVTNLFTPGNAAMPKPDRWRETISFNYGTLNLTTGQQTVRNPLFRRSYEYCRAFWPDDTQVGRPRYFCDYNYSNWLFAPTPDQAYPFEVNYWELPALLDANNTTNWTSIYAPECLLYAALLECAPFLKDDNRLQLWEGEYMKRSKSLGNEDIQAMISAAPETQQSVQPGGGK